MNSLERIRAAIGFKPVDRVPVIAQVLGHAAVLSGVHLPMLFDPSASPAVVPPAFFHQFLCPRLKRIFDAFQKQGALANRLHIPGPAATVFPFYPDLNANLANFDYRVSPDQACRALAGTCLNGNIKSISFMEATKEEIIAAARDLLDFFADRGGFILSSGREIPPEARPENIAAMIMAVE